MRLMAMLLLLVMSALPAWSDVYKCPDGKGGQVLQDVPCSGSQTPFVPPPSAPEPLRPVCQERAPGTSAAHHDQAMAAESLKALRKISAATEVGINFRDYGLLVVDAKAAVNDATVNISDNALKTELYQAIQAYADALTAWNISLKTDGFLIIKGGTTSDEGYWQGLALHEKYHFTSDVFHISVSKKNALNTIWKVAKAHFLCATELAK